MKTKQKAVFHIPSLNCVPDLDLSPGVQNESLKRKQLISDQMDIDTSSNMMSKRMCTKLTSTAANNDSLSLQLNNPESLKRKETVCKRIDTHIFMKMTPMPRCEETVESMVLPTKKKQKIEDFYKMKMAGNASTSAEEHSKCRFFSFALLALLQLLCYNVYLFLIFDTHLLFQLNMIQMLRRLPVYTNLMFQIKVVN
jgi:hypothetical protein